MGENKSNLETLLLSMVKEHNLDSPCFLKDKIIQRIDIKLHLEKDDIMRKIDETIEITKDCELL